LADKAKTQGNALKSVPLCKEKEEKILLHIFRKSKTYQNGFVHPIHSGGR
jgi:hypothetical protein